MTMKQLGNLLSELKGEESVNRLSYTDLVSLIQEENRPSGGKKSISELVSRSYLHTGSKVLEVGCTNGFSSLEIGRLVRCQVVGIDINPHSVANAQARAEFEGEAVGKVSFQVASADEIPFPDSSFDLVVAGNATSFMRNKEGAVREYLRVLRSNGFLGLVPIWYRKEPSEELLDKLQEVLGFRITPFTRQQWIELFTNGRFEFYHGSDYEFLPRTSEDIAFHVEQITQKEHLLALPAPVLRALRDRWAYILGLFAENLELCGYSVVLLRKRIEPEEHELFLTTAK